MSEATITTIKNEHVGHDLLCNEPSLVESVRILCNASNDAGFRNWFRDAFEEGYARKGMNAGEIAVGMLLQRVAYLHRIR